MKKNNDYKRNHQHHEGHGKNHHQKREEKHLLKKQIIKALQRKGQVNFSELVLKLDIQPSKLFRILKNFEHKGLIYHEKEQQPEVAAGKKGKAFHKHEKKSVHHRNADRKRVHAGGHHCSRRADKGGQKKEHSHRAHKHGKGPWQHGGNVKIGLVPA